MKDVSRSAEADAANQEALENGIRAMVDDENLWMPGQAKEAREAHVRRWLAGKIGTMEGPVTKPPVDNLAKNKMFEARANALRDFLPKEDQEAVVGAPPMVEVSYTESLQNRVDELKAQMAQAPKTNERAQSELATLEKRLYQARGLEGGTMTPESILEEDQKAYQEKMDAYTATDALFAGLATDKKGAFIDDLVRLIGYEEMMYPEEFADEWRLRCDQKSSQPDVLLSFMKSIVKDYVGFRGRSKEIMVMRIREKVEQELNHFQQLQARWNALTHAGANLGSQNMFDLRKEILDVGRIYRLVPEFQTLFSGFENISLTEFAETDK